MAELKDLLEERRKMVDKKATEHRELRDDWNEKTKEFTTTRNELNNEVRELIVQVREQRDLRDQMNEMVREKKRSETKPTKRSRPPRIRFAQPCPKNPWNSTDADAQSAPLRSNRWPARWSVWSGNSTKESILGQKPSRPTSRK